VEVLARKLRLNAEPEKLWYDSILVVYNRFSKISHFIVTTEKITAEGLVRLFSDNV